MRRGGDAYTTVGCGHFALADLAETVKQGITTYCRWIARAAIGSRGPGNQEKRSEDECGPRPDGPESFRAVRLSPFHPKQRLVKGKGFS